MIIEASKLRGILDFIFHEYKHSVNLEISSSDDENYLIFAVNYGDLYYISYKIAMTNEIEENVYIVLSKYALTKLDKLTNLWPKCTIKILYTKECISVEVVNSGQLLRERQVAVECVFEKSSNDYIISANNMNHNCIVNSRNLKQMLEFCYDSNEGIILELRNKNLLVSNSNCSTLVELDEIISIPPKPIKLSAEANQLIISFLNKLVKYNTVYLLFIEPENAFSIKVKTTDSEYLQLYTIHD
jgi:hypothetical protein